MNNSLNGMNILVTRAEHQAAELNQLIQQFGGCPINLPLQKVVQIEVLPKKLYQLVEETDWLLFTSVNAVIYFVQNSTKELIELVNNKKIGAVGEKTKKVLEEHGIEVTFMPSQFTGKTLATELSSIVGDESKFLFIRGSLASETVPTILGKNGHLVTLLTVYETIPNTNVRDDLITLLLQKKVDVITFLNPFSVKQFCYLIDETIDLKELEHVRIACIGDVTALEASQSGFKHILVPSKFTIDSLIKKIAEDVTT